MQFALEMTSKLAKLLKPFKADLINGRSIINFSFDSGTKYLIKNNIASFTSNYKTKKRTNSVSIDTN